MPLNLYSLHEEHYLRYSSPDVYHSLYYNVSFTIVYIMYLWYHIQIVKTSWISKLE